MSKKYYYSVLLFFYIILLSGCSEEPKQDYFNGKVLEIHDTYLLVQPNENESVYEISNEISVMTDIIAAAGVPDLQVGDEIRILYKDIDEDSDPPSLKTVFAIYLASDLK